MISKDGNNVRPPHNVTGSLKSCEVWLKSASGELRQTPANERKFCRDFSHTLTWWYPSIDFSEWMNTKPQSKAWTMLWPG